MMELSIHNASPALITSTSVSLAATVGLLVLSQRLRKQTLDAEHPTRLSWGVRVGSACSGILTISYFVWMMIVPVIHVWYPMGPLVVIGNVVNIVCGIWVLSGLTAEGVMAALLIGINQILWIIFGILVFTTSF
jgi:hypothetical protein